LTGDLYHYAAEKTMNTVPVTTTTGNRRRRRGRRLTRSRSTRAQLWIQHDIQKNATLKRAPQ
jgi:hypothetical protein